MTITLPPDQDILMPLVRICVMEQGHWTDIIQPWVVLPIPQRMDRLGRRYYGKRHGYELDSVESPPALPITGAAVFHFDYGSINGVDYDIDGDDQLTARDLLGYDVRIQMAPAPTSLPTTGPFQPQWATVFLGTVISQDDDPWADDQVSQTLSGGGRRTYRCADLLWRTARWPMNRHTAVVKDDLASVSATNPRMFVHSYGHPGYNFSIQGYYRRLFGNKYAGTWPISGDTPPDPFGDIPPNLSNYLPHSWPGAGSSYVTTWTDLEAINHALASSRTEGEPCFSVQPCDASGNSTAVLNASKGAWEVSEGESCWDFINRVLARQRCRGMAKLSWSDNAFGALGSYPSENDATRSVPGNIYPFIVIYPQFYDNITFTPPGGSEVTFYGAKPESCNTAIAVDLAGDHRVPKDGIAFSQNETASVDYLESFGEPIELLVTLSPKDGPHADGTDGTLAKRWSSSDESDFAALDVAKPWLKTNDRWKYVWQRWSLRPNWDFYVGDGLGANLHNVNFYCDDDGAIQTFDLGTSSSLWDVNGLGTASPLTARILSDLPIYEGYDYTSNAPTRYDGSTDTISPPRLPPILLANDGSGHLFDVTADGYGLQNDDWGLLVSNGDDLQRGTRGFSDPATSQLGNRYGYGNLVVTVGIQLPHRVRIAKANIIPGSVSPDNPGGTPYTVLDTPRKKSLYFSGIFLWLADYKAIWSMYDTAATNAYGTPKRGAAGGNSSTPGILRDDRVSLATLHNLAWAWYSVTHRTAQWSMRDCGLLPSFTNTFGGSNTTVNYPTVGQFVTTVTCSQIFTSNTPITRVVYDARSGVTTWFTDWCDLDLTQ